MCVFVLVMWRFGCESLQQMSATGLTFVFFSSSLPYFPSNPPLLTRLTHDISLDEFEDDDLSEITEITDERGLSLNCNGPDIKVRRPR